MTLALLHVYGWWTTAILAEGVGCIYMDAIVNGQKMRCLFKDVLYAPRMACSLISIRQLADHGFGTEFDRDGAKVRDADGQIKVEAKIEDGLYKLQGHAAHDHHVHIGRVVKEDVAGQIAKAISIQKSAASLHLWHCHLGHISANDVHHMVQKGMVDGMEIIPQATEGFGVCKACLQGKQNHEPIPKESDLYRIHSDLCNVGDSQEGYCYFATFINDFSCYTKVMPLNHKDETLNAFKKFIAHAENETGKHVKHFRTDRGGEFYSKEFSAFCDEKGIVQEKTNPDTLQQNSITKHKGQMPTTRHVQCLLVQDYHQNSGYQPSYMQI
jgi:hypothetical protein